MVGPGGASSVGLITDLTYEDVMKFKSAPAIEAAFNTARLSTEVIPAGTLIIRSGRRNLENPPKALLRKYWNLEAVKIQEVVCAEIDPRTIIADMEIDLEETKEDLLAALNVTKIDSLDREIRVNGDTLPMHSQEADTKSSPYRLRCFKNKSTCFK